MRECQAEVHNVFCIKQDGASLFVMDVLKIIQSNVEKLLSRKTYADTAPRKIGAIQLPLLESRSSYWTIEVNVEEHNGIYILVKELLLFFPLHQLKDINGG